MTTPGSVVDRHTGHQFTQPAWPSHWNLSRRHPDTGLCTVGAPEIELPSLRELERHALWIARGGLTRLRRPFSEWMDAARQDPGQLKLSAEIDPQSIGGALRWRLEFFEAADEDEYATVSWSSGMQSPDHALAWMVAACWERHMEIVTNACGLA